MRLVTRLFGGTIPRAAALMAVLVSLALATGCANKRETRYADDYYGDEPVSAREYGYVRPASDVWVLGDAGRSSRARAAHSGGGDLWGRVRVGMQLDRHAHQRIDAKVAAFRRDPQYLARMSERARPYLRVVVDEIERRGLPMELALLPHVESRYNPAATSHKAAAGMWQFIPSTGTLMGLKQDGWHDQRRDILASTRAGLDYLEQLHRRLGDWELAMAAYNCGPGRVESAQAANRRAGKPTDYWSLRLPTETVNYVPQILAAARLVSEPQRYGLHLPAVPSAPQLEVVRSDRPLSLTQVAHASGVSLTELRKLNAGLKRGQTTPAVADYVVVPAGSGKRAAAKLKRAQVVLASASATGGAAPVRRAPRRAEPESPFGVPTASTGGTSVEGSVYVVRAGESLASIAAARGIEAETLADFNAMRLGEPLLPGQSLRIPDGVTDSELVTHRVRKGDSLGVIARRYNVSIDDLKRWNRLAENDLRTGAVLRIYRRGGTPAT